MRTKAKTIVMTVLLGTACCNLALGQATPATILAIDVVNAVGYQSDVADYSKLATDANPTIGAPSKNFS